MNLKSSYLQGLQNFYNLKAPEGFVYVKGMDFDGTEKLSPESEVFIKNRKIHIDDFYMCDHPVTQDEFKAIFPERYTYYSTCSVVGDDLLGSKPAPEVKWYDAIAYCNKRSVMEGLTPCYIIPGVTDVEGFSWENFPYSSIPVDELTYSFKLGAATASISYPLLFSFGVRKTTRIALMRAVTSSFENE